MSNSPHVADAEVQFRVVNVTPDFCKVNDKIVAFEIYRDLTHERLSYAKTVRARGEPVLTIASVVAGVVGNMGEGVVSTVSMGSGDVVMIQGSTSVRAEGNAVCRHGDLCWMNAKLG